MRLIAEKNHGRRKHSGEADPFARKRSKLLENPEKRLSFPRTCAFRDEYNRGEEKCRFLATSKLLYSEAWDAASGAGVCQMPSVETEIEKQAAQGASMEITVSRQDLVKELTATQSVVERKTTIPILSNFLLEADEDKLNITATDLDQAIRTSAVVKVKKAGACTIPARKLYDYIKLLPDGDISIKLLENHWVQIRSGRSNTKMVGMARANYPQVPEFPTVASTSISLAALRALIARTIFAISNEESRYTLNGALLVLKAESLAMVATDGHRLAYVEKPGETLEGISGEKRVLVPRKALQELQVLLSSTEAEKIDFADDEHTLFFRVGHRTLSSRLRTTSSRSARIRRNPARARTPSIRRTQAIRSRWASTRSTSWTF